MRAGPVPLLLVDDHPENLVALKAILESPDYRLVTAASGPEALEKIAQDEFALILLDVAMPAMTGFDVADQLKKDERTRHIPIIFLTAIATGLEEIYRAYRIGAVDYLVKPLDRDAVRAKVAVFADLHRRKVSAERQERLAYENRRLYESAELGARARHELLHVVAHDLRTPIGTVLATIRGARAVVGRDPVHAEALLAEAERTTETMGRLADDLVDVEALETGRLSIRKASQDAAALLGDAVALVRPHARDQRVTIRLDDAGVRGVVVPCDRDRVLQVLANLLDNAITFSPPGATITLGARREADDVHAWVSDEGPGIDAERLPFVFDRIWQAKQATRTGLGLGLSIARGLVRAHEGRIWAESLPGKGSTFHFTLPGAHASEMQPSAPGGR